jgi:branched-chain amino acid transport system substrate-binding protein
MMRAEGKTVVLAVWRDDIGNRGLATSVSDYMKANGGAVVGGFEYSTTTTDFGPIVAQMRTELDIAVKIYGKEKVAVYVPAFDEVVDLAAAIPADDTLLRGVRWYGGDGTVNSTALAPQVAFFEQVGYPCPDVGIGDAIERAKPIIERIQTATGIVPDAFALCVYDAVWLAGMSMLNGPHSEGGSVLRQRVTDAASVYYGASGWTKLNDAGDRAYGVYDMKVLRRVNGTPTWVTVGTWDAIKGYTAR